MLALVGTVMLRSTSRTVLLRDGDRVLGTHRLGLPVQAGLELARRARRPRAAIRGVRCPSWRMCAPAAGAVRACVGRSSRAAAATRPRSCRVRVIINHRWSAACAAFWNPTGAPLRFSRCSQRRLDDARGAATSLRELVRETFAAASAVCDARIVEAQAGTSLDNVERSLPELLDKETAAQHRGLLRKSRARSGRAARLCMPTNARAGGAVRAMANESGRGAGGFTCLRLAPLPDYDLGRVSDRLARTAGDIPVEYRVAPRASHGQADRYSQSRLCLLSSPLVTASSHP